LGVTLIRLAGPLLFTALSSLTVLLAGCGSSGADPTVTASPTAVPTSSERQSGDVLGIYLAKNETLLEEGYIVNLLELCPEGLEIVQEHESVPPAPSSLPAGLTQPPALAGNIREDPNPAAYVCPTTGEPYRAWRYYEGGSGVNVMVLRVHLERPYRQIDLSRDAVTVEMLGGREVIVIADGEAVEVIIPEAGGYLSVDAEGLDESIVRTIAESLAAVARPAS
jgi:hypothetical protein